MAPHAKHVIPCLSYLNYNSPKMVRLIFTLIFVHIIVLCVGQTTAAGNKILFSASFNKDTVFIGDSLTLTISFKNESEDTLKLYSEGRVVISHYHPDLYISYESMERAFYILREYTNPNSIIWLKPKEEFQYTFDIEVKGSFFYDGENTVYVSYRNIWNDPVEYKKRKTTEREPKIMFDSSPIKIISKRKVIIVTATTLS